MIYADNASTTKVCRAATEKMLPFLHNNYGNPSAPNSLGAIAKNAISEAESQIISLLNQPKGRIIFTSGGSEANNQAILTAAEHAKSTGRTRLVTTEIEHDSVYKPLKALAENGFDVVFVKPQSNGCVSLAEIEKHIDSNTAFVSVMTANNETGVIQPVAEIYEYCRKHGVLFHTDAVQAADHIPFMNMEADMISLSAHKFGGVKGVGGLYVRNGINAVPLILGGNQQNGIRAGTEPVPLIAAMAAALEDAVSHFEEKQKTQRLRNSLEQRLKQIPESLVNGADATRLEGHLNISFKGINSDALLMLLEENGICAAKGSACCSGEESPSRVLTAMGIKEEYALGTVRFSLNRENTQEDINTIADTTEKAIKKLRELI